ncbi:MAG: hypothetical protein CSA96_03795 [Bacteroidetes bacterium]|nr:MAG: hypothetical protein CSA96_03795 [Bacteroidota bacterium]
MNMEKIHVNKDELSEMRQFYKEEYERLSRRVEHIRQMLEKLGPEPENELENRSGQSKPRKRAGRKPKWEQLIIKRMRQLDRPVTYEELTDEIMTAAKIEPSKRKATKQALINVVFRLRSRDEKLDTFSIGTKEKYIALKGWFDKPGKIKREYLRKINHPKAQPPAKAKKMKA